MENIFGIETQEELDELTRCLEKCRDCACLATIHQISQHKDDVTTLVVEQVSVTTNNLINISGDYVYLTLMSQDSLDLQQIKSMFKTVLERNTSRFTSGKAGDYELTIDLIQNDEFESMVWRISLLSPVFMTDDNGKLMIMFAKNCAVFSEDSIDFTEVANEVEYLEELDRENEESKISEMYEEEEEETEENADILSNDEYIYGMTDNTEE